MYAPSPPPSTSTSNATSGSPPVRGKGRDMLRQWTARLPLIFLFACLLLPALLSAQERPSATIDIDLKRTAKSTLFNRVALLPFTGQYSDLPQLRKVLFEELDRIGKYDLIAPSQVDFLLDRQAPEKDNEHHSFTASTVIDAGKTLHARGIITGKFSHLEASSNTEATISAHSRLLIELWDIHSGQKVWTILITLSEANDDPALDSTAFPNAIGEAVNLLLDNLLQMGAIYSPRVPAPTILSTQGGIRTIRVLLQPAPGYIHSAYQLLKADSPKGIFIPLGAPVPNTTPPLVLEDNQLQDASTYWYTVIGINPQGLASIPRPPFAITTRGRPQAVTSVNAAGNGLRQIHLSWELSPDPDIVGYAIYRKDKVNGHLMKIYETDNRDQQSYLDRGSAKSYERYGKLADNTRYYYIVRSKNKVSVESDDSPVASALTKGAPPPPTRLQAIDNLPRQVSLSWKESSDPHTRGYALFRATKQEGPYEKVTFIEGRLTKETVDRGSSSTPLQDNTRYYYKMQAVNVVNTSSMDSAVVYATTKPVPQAVVPVSTPEKLVKKVQLAWQANPESDIAGYEIFSGDRPEGVDRKITSLPADRRTYTQTGLGDGQTLWYRIRAVDHDGLHGHFSPLIRKTTKPLPARPVELRARINDSAVVLTWRANREEDIDFYKVVSVGFLNKVAGRPQTNRFQIREGLEPGREYRFLVQAVDKDGLESMRSATVSIRYPADKKKP